MSQIKYPYYSEAFINHFIFTTSNSDPYVYAELKESFVTKSPNEDFIIGQNLGDIWAYALKVDFEKAIASPTGSSYKIWKPLNLAGYDKLLLYINPEDTFQIKGKVVYNNEPIIGLKVSAKENNILDEVITDAGGNFFLKGIYSTPFNIEITDPNKKYSTFITFPFDSNNKVISDLGILVMSPLVLGLGENISKESSLSKSSIDAIVASKTDFETLQQQKLINLLKTLKYTLLPLILKQFYKFGVVNIQQALDKKFNIQPNCPSQAELLEIINKKNKLVKQLNTTYKIIEATTIFVAGLEILLTSLQTLKSASLAIPYPLPPAVGAALDETDKKIKKYQAIISSFSLLLNILKTTLKEIIDYLNLLDSYVQTCNPDANQEQIAQELTALTIQQSTQTSPVITSAYGFKMGVETEVTNSPLKRRRAIATNKQNIVMLQGEWSYSSIDQILIDELIFYIRQNNLKAD
jgi:hypothetical protein